MRSVGFRRVDQGHAEMNRALQRGDRLAPPGRRPPHAGAGDAHRSKSETADRKVAPEKKLASHLLEPGRSCVWEMCGIAGIVANSREIDRDVLGAMAAMPEHR